VIETTRALNPPEAPGRKVEIAAASDGQQPVALHVQTRGSGDTTVILDGGVGETSFDWDKVAEQVSGFAKVVSVDRPGLGYSDPAGATPRTSMQVRNAA
jgi:pimeloyl-ACP methyl ester carboxylesterase